MKSFFEKIAGSMRMSKTLDELEKEHEDKFSVQDLHEESDEEIIGLLPIDLYDNGSEYVLHAFIPGVRSDEIVIEATRDTLTLSGSRQAQRMRDSAISTTKELYWGAFTRTISLSDEIDIDGIDATEKQGLLTLRLPKLDKNRQAKVKIKSGI